MDSKIIFYVVVALIYYGYQAYKKFSVDKNTPETLPPIPQPSPTQSYPKHVPRSAPDLYEEAQKPEIISEKYATYESVENEKTKTFAFKPLHVEEGLNSDDLKSVDQYHKPKKNNKTKIEVLQLLKNKPKLKTAFIFNEVMQRKF